MVVSISTTGSPFFIVMSSGSYVNLLDTMLIMRGVSGVEEKPKKVKQPITTRPTNTVFAANPNFMKSLFLYRLQTLKRQIEVPGMANGDEFIRCCEKCTLDQNAVPWRRNQALREPLRRCLIGRRRRTELDVAGFLIADVGSGWFSI